MLFTKKSSLEEKIVEFLLDGEHSALEINNFVCNSGSQVTIQAVYKSLRGLLFDGVVIKHRKSYSVSEEWILKTQEHLRRRPLFSLADGNTVTYKFSSFSQTDAYWKHLVFNIPQEDLEAPFFAYTPHNFWVHNPARFESEMKYYKNFEVYKRDAFLVVGGFEEGDLQLAKRLQNKFLRIHLANYPQFKRTQHVSIMGNYITTVSVDNKTATLIDTLYASCSGSVLSDKLEKIFKSKVNIKIRLECAKQKASKLKKILGRDFYLPKEVRDNL